MKHRAIRRSLPLVVLGLSLLASAVQANDFGKNRYNCQVTTVNKNQGFIGVQAHTLKEAIAMAGSAKQTTTRGGVNEAAKEVVQCVLWPDGKFTDAGFQTWVDEVMPR